MKYVLAGSVLLALSGCGFIPTENTDHKPMLIIADGEDFHTCDSFIMDSSSSFGQTIYELSFTQNGLKVKLNGVKKVEIIEQLFMIDESLPLYLPNILTDKDKDGQPYKEGLVYTFFDGSQAMVKNGKWAAAKKKRNPICDIP
jgi:hypothetical protein